MMTSLSGPDSCFETLCEGVEVLRALQADSAYPARCFLSQYLPTAAGRIG